MAGESADGGARQDGGRGGDPLGDAEDLNPGHFFLAGEIDRGEGGFSPALRFAENRAAIETLRNLEEEKRPATDDERRVLARYNGWGGLAGVFETLHGPSDPKWMREARPWVREHLSAEEREAASASTLNAHFTSPEVIRGIWAAVGRMGFRGGRVLEPAMGIGSFFGTMPPELAKRSKLVGVELDPLTGDMARAVYPDADIRVEGFEETKLPDGFFDLTVGNVPFGNFGVHDPRYNKYSLSLHDWFVVKALDKTKQGGICALITSGYTMDKANRVARTLMSERGELLGAVRMPYDAQAAQAGCEVTTDLLLFRRRVEPAPVERPEWVETGRVERTAEWAEEPLSFRVNRYFLDHPDRVIGEFVAERGDRGSPRLAAKTSEARGEWAGRIVEAAPENVFAVVRAGDAVAGDGRIEEPPRTMEIPEFGVSEIGCLIEGDDGLIYRIEDTPEGGREGVETGLRGKRKDRVAGMIAVRDAMREVIDGQVRNAGEAELRESRKRLNLVYDAFTERYGWLNQAINKRLFQDDPSAGRLQALEHYDAETERATKADLFDKRVIGVVRRLEATDDPREALLVVVSDRGWVDLAAVAGLLRLDAGKTADLLSEKGEIFLDPGTEQWEIAAKYLSGNVRAKLKEAEAAAGIDPRYRRNVDALAAVIPEDIPLHEIEANLGSSWLPEDVVKGFMCKVLGYGESSLRVEHRVLAVDDAWLLRFDRRAARSDWNCDEQKIDGFGTQRRTAADLVESAMNHRSVAVYDVDPIDGTRTLNAKETAAAEEAAARLKGEFAAWLPQDAQRANRVARLYNDRFNTHVRPVYDGAHMRFPGMSAAVELRPHQKNAALRALLEDNVLLGHGVGTGKTYCMVSIAMEMKRIGKASKPLIAVPNHMLEQIRREAYQLYPNARILTVGKRDLAKDKRKVFLGRAANNDWDLVVVSHSMLSKLGVGHKYERRLLSDRKEELRAWLIAAGDEGNRLRVKEIERKIASYDARLKKLMPDNTEITLGEMGIDALIVDEAHNFKNLATEGGRSIAGDISGSNRAWDLYMKIGWLYAKRGEQSGVVFATGTPVSNNILELYNLQRYLQPGVLAENGNSHINAWAGTFLSERTRWEPDPGGTGWIPRTRYALTNAPELMRQLSLTMDFVTADDANIPRPEVETLNVSVPMTPLQRRIMDGLAARAIAIRDPGSDIDPSEDNLLKIVSEGRRMSLDPRLLDPSEETGGQLKHEAMTENVLEIHGETEGVKGVQLVFCDIGTPGPNKKFDIYNEVKRELVARGVPESEIAFIHDASGDDEKAALFARARSGDVRVLMGSTAKMGEGVNVQTRVCALHHLDAPWRPSDIEQRDGRMVRFGNLFGELHGGVRRFIYTTEGSFDMFMWTTLKTKNDTFGAVLKGDPSVRTFDDAVDPTYAETVAITTDNPLLKEKMELEQELVKLRLLSRVHEDGQWGLRREIGRLRDELDEKKEVLEARRTLPSVDPERKWSLELGGATVFEGPREKLLPKLNKLIAERKWDGAEGLKFGGAEVVVRRGENDKGKPATVWSCGECAYRRAADLEDGLLNRDKDIDGAERAMKRIEGYIAENEGRMKENPYKERLDEATERKAELERKIAAAAEKQRNEDPPDPDRDPDGGEELEAESIGGLRPA